MLPHHVSTIWSTTQADTACLVAYTGLYIRVANEAVFAFEGCCVSKNAGVVVQHVRQRLLVICMH